ncbi:MAG: hypothetical protein WC763_04735 [Candidatus Paceibacterota bacterium]|jgi:hypothetical protein
MSTGFTIDSRGFRELQAAAKRNPEKVKSEVGKFLQRGMAAYKRVIFNSPWRVGGSGGGAPVAQAESGGNLRQTHMTEIQAWQARVFPTAPYAPYVHGIEGYPRKRSYQLRPWLDYAAEKSAGEIEKLQDEMIGNIVGDLAK